MKNSDVVIFIQARMGSSRLPGKVLKKLNGTEILGIVVEKVRKEFENIVVLTSIEKQDDEIMNYCNKIKIKCFRGSENNVLNRFIKASAVYGKKYVVRICADSPFMSGKIIKRVFQIVDGKHDLISTRYIDEGNKLISYSAKGLSVDIIKASTLDQVDDRYLNDFQKEHVIPVFYKKPYSYNIFKFPEVSNENFAVDTQDDFSKIEKDFFVLEKLVEGFE